MTCQTPFSSVLYASRWLSLLVMYSHVVSAQFGSVLSTPPAPLGGAAGAAAGPTGGSVVAPAEAPAPLILCLSPTAGPTMIESRRHMVSNTMNNNQRE